MATEPGTAEQRRLAEARDKDILWRKWGPYLSERQWGTVREYYSDNGDAWNYFTHAIARTLRLRNSVAVELTLVGSADIQSLADLANSYEVVRGMRAAPFGRDTIIQLGVPAVLPLLPLALTVLPAEEILKRLAGMLL